jgi:hypothetical protein
MIAMHNHVHNCFTYTAIPDDKKDSGQKRSVKS